MLIVGREEAGGEPYLIPSHAEHTHTALYLEAGLLSLAIGML